MVCAAVLLPGLLVPHRGVPRPDLRLPDLVARRRALRPDHVGARRRGPQADRARPGHLGRRRGGRLDRLPLRRPGRRRLRRARPELLDDVHPAGAARCHRADRREHRPRQGGRGDDRRRPRPLHGPRDRRRRRSRPRFASAFGGSPTTTYAENIGVMGATRVYSTAAYYVAAIVAILLGLCPKFGAVVNATPGGVLGGITIVLYGMIGLVGREDLGRERRRLRRPGQPGRARRRPHRRHRRRDPADHRRLRARRHRAGHDPGHRVLPPGEPRVAGRQTKEPGTSPGLSDSARPARPGRTLQVKPAPFEFARPASVAEALEALAAHPDAKVLAGGQSLVPLLSMRLAAPSVLVDINGLAELASIETDPDPSPTASGSARSPGTPRSRRTPGARRVQPLLVRRRCGWSPTPRSATGARRSARSSTPTPPRRCRWCCCCSAAA